MLSRFDRRVVPESILDLLRACRRPQVERLWLNPQLQAALAAEDEQMVLPGVACA